MPAAGTTDENGRGLEGMHTQTNHEKEDEPEAVLAYKMAQFRSNKEEIFELGILTCNILDESYSTVQTYLGTSLENYGTLICIFSRPICIPIYLI
ncbi:unnamed protein product [Enterobius vermicularis]|uniref:DDE_Tnp_1_7 domain-containing protein n=1 Tax=Enterobius vermicularis TaxID=51028 RepID=A0A0N4UXF7_ENTVE|nr:unnamed protein product [Enterobius vermicularis]